MENDAAAAVLGESWRGGHGRCRNIVAMTLGTG
ncbi:MAG: ROK family protein, partial [Calothrix sp. SM1_5_4]|nr:ROK family protein [Calothrix sp. SM1_5_4]